MINETDSLELEFSEQVTKLTKQLRKNATNLTKRDLRYLVDTYEQIQKHRIRAGHQVKAAERDGEEPNPVIIWMHQNYKKLEYYIKSALNAYTDADPVGRWAKSITGIGPVTAAGLLAHIDITKAPTVGHIWRFAGLDPTIEWKAGQKRPYNVKLKVICYHIGQGFVRNKNRSDNLYSRLYVARKQLETEKNERGEYAQQAEETLKKKRIGKNTDAYKWYSQGKLPPARIELRAQRYAVKIFLSHLHEIMYRVYLKEEPPKPYVLEHMGHVDKIEVPNLDVIKEYL